MLAMTKRMLSRIVKLARWYLALGLCKAGFANLVATCVGLLVAIIGHFAIAHVFTVQSTNTLAVQYARFFAYTPLFFTLILDIAWAATCISKVLQCFWTNKR